MECHEAPVRADRRHGAGLVALRAAGIHADPLRHSRLTVVQKNVIETVGIARHQIRRMGPECHVAPVGADRGLKAEEVRLNSARIHADPRRLAGLPITHEDVRLSIRVGGH